LIQQKTLKMSKTATTPSSSAKTQNLTKEEELLLKDYSRNVSTKSSALFYGNAAIVAAIPICKPPTRPTRSVSPSFA
jgi:hypothetical protein